MKQIPKVWLVDLLGTTAMVTRGQTLAAAKETYFLSVHKLRLVKLSLLDTTKLCPVWPCFVSEALAEARDRITHHIVTNVHMREETKST